jgi:hypothetical protein
VVAAADSVPSIGRALREGGKSQIQRVGHLWNDRPRPNLLSGVSWGTPGVLGQTLARITEAGLTV